MTAAQYKRANTVVYPILLVILGYECLIMFGLMTKTGAAWNHWLQMIVSVLAIIVITVFFLTKRDQKSCAIGMLSCASLAYMVIVLCSNNVECFAYGFPILFSTMVLLNFKYVLAGDIIIVLTNVIKLAMQYGAASDDMKEALFVAVFASVLTCFAASSVVKLLIKNNEENIETITAAAQKQEASHKKTIAVAEEVSQHFVEAMEMLDRLNQSVDTSNFAMSNIAESTESTAEAIQEQANMCTEIQGHTDVAERETKNMTSACGAHLEGNPVWSLLVQCP